MENYNDIIDLLKNLTSEEKIVLVNHPIFDEILAKLEEECVRIKDEKK